MTSRLLRLRLPLVLRRRLCKVCAGVALFVLFFLFFLIVRIQTRIRPSEISGDQVYPRIRFRGAERAWTSQTVARIPHVIHQTWKTAEVPVMLAEWVASWRKRHPLWEYWFWTDQDLDRLVDTNFPRIAPLFKGYPMAGYRADVFRYLVLYIHGGVYADLDMESLLPLDTIFYVNGTAEASTRNDVNCILSQEPEEHAYFLSPVGVPLVSNALMACRPGHPFFQQVIDALPNYAGWLHWTDILHATGPYMLTKEYHRYGMKTGCTLGMELNNVMARSSKNTAMQRSSSNHTASKSSCSNLLVRSSNEIPGLILLAPAELFQPLVDRSMLDSMRQRCFRSPSSSLSEEALAERWRICDAARSRTLMDRSPAGALTVHHFTHTWAGRRYDPWGVFNSRHTVNVETLVATDGGVVGVERRQL